MNEELRAQADALAAVGGRMATLDAETRRTQALAATGAGVLMGLALLVPAVFRPDRHLPAFLAAMAVFLGAVVVLVVWYQRRRRAVTVGWGRRYVLGMVLTAALYVAAVLLTVGRPWPWALVAAVVVAAPVTIAGWWRR